MEVCIRKEIYFFRPFELPLQRGSGRALLGKQLLPLLLAPVIFSVVLAGCEQVPLLLVSLSPFSSSNIVLF